MVEEGYLIQTVDHDYIERVYLIASLIAAGGLLLGYLIVSCVARALVFKRSGESMWKAFVPFYSTYTSHSIVFDVDKKRYSLLLLVPYLNLPYLAYMWYGLARSFGLDPFKSIMYVLFPAVGDLIIGCSDTIKYKGPVNHFSNDLRKK